ncbi:hypothetical protein BGY98DRAFT_957988 [Russula aff. rugulosa BPL654]|nr:hypothetical protein BGY98DRAFT_957988 [Russula aff. rugulosa BPL654]
MAELSLTQTSEQSPKIFVDTAGYPLPVYLDVNPEIPARPRLIRLLRASGANISHSPSAAAILLISSDSEPGRKFVHHWHADSDKTILKYNWIQACVRAGRALLEADDWGGFRVFHTSECTYSDEEGDEDLDDEQSGTHPLTAHQTTPNERKISSTLPSRSKASLNSTRSKPPSLSPRSSEQNVKFNTPSLTRRPTSSGRSGSNFIPAQSPSSTVTSSAVIPPSPKIAAGSSPQTSPIRHHPALTIHERTPHTLPSSQQNSMPPPRSFPQTTDTPTSALSHPQVPAPLSTNYSAPQHSSPSGSTDLLHVLNHAFQMQNTASQVQNAANQTLTQLVETVIAVAQGQGLDTGIIQNYLATLPMAPSLNQPSSSSQMQDPTLHSVEEKPASCISEPSLKNVDKSRASTSNPRSLVSSEPSLPPKRKRKSLESPLPAKKVISNSRQNPSGTHPESPQSGRGVFSMKNGQPMLVFVQIDTRGRHEIVHQIKKNGGKITADIPKAAFVILNPRSVSYPDLRQEADDSGRTIVQTPFVTESIKQGHLLDPNDYLLGDASSPRKPNRSGHRPTTLRDKHSPESDHAISETQTSDTVVDAAPPIPAREHSVTPEPPAAVQSKNGFRFTPAEMTYTWALIRRIITKDPLASRMAVAKALHEKMPHHPVSSWLSTLTRQREIFTTASEPHPPASDLQDSTYQPRNETSDVEMDEAGRDTEELEELQVGASLLAEGDSIHDDEQRQSLPGENSSERDAYVRDFEALVGFLTSADSDGGRDDEIFQRLAAKNTCMTAPSWPEFLEQHAEAVTEEVERRYTT